MKLRKLNCVLIAVLAILILVSFYETSLTGNIINSRLLSQEDYVNVYVRVDENSIYLISGCDALVMSTTPEQTNSILLGLENVTGPRPLTHDLIKDIFDLSGTEVMMVKIEKLEDSTYYARLFLIQGNRILNLDSRPSDAIAIALRYRKPILVREELFGNVSRKVC